MDGTVLVADDDRTIRTVLTQALTRAGCRVHATSSLTTLMRWVDEGKGDAVITDVMMPDGNEFISEGVYSEIDPPNKLVTSANFRPMTEGVQLEVLLEAEGDTTHFTFNVIHPTAEYREQQEKMGIYNGWGGAFDRLEAFLDSLA